MKFFITGTDTNVGKTTISSWICLHTGYGYFKPIQTGTDTDQMDSYTVSQLAQVHIYPEVYSFKQPLSPHLASQKEGKVIELNDINLPTSADLIVEGAGGLFVPINSKYYIIDLISKFDIPVILVCRSTLGTINHSLLSIEALKARNIKVAGIVVSGNKNRENALSIAHYGKVDLLAEFPLLSEVSRFALDKTPLTNHLKNLFKI